MPAFYFMRHGKIDDEIMHGGGSDVPLNEAGRKQCEAIRLHELLPDLKSICISPMARAGETCSIIASDSSAEKIMIEELREWRVGNWERQPYNEFSGQILSWQYDPPNGETRDAFEQRVRRAIDIVLSKEGESFMISHGGVWDAIGRVLGFTAHHIGNAEIMRVNQDESGLWVATSVATQHPPQSIYLRLPIPASPPVLR